MKLTVELDGKQIPLADCRWVRIDPRGCVEGSSYAERVDRTLATEAQAHEIFTPRARDRARETRAGWRHELVTRERWRAEAEPCLRGRCRHRPDAPATA
jgi:hypothetical protein